MSTDPEYPPQSSLDENNQFVGFDIDVGRQIADRLGVDIEFVTPSWDVITAGNWAGRWDVSVGSMTPTAARREVLDFPAVYYYTPAALVVHADNNSIAAPADASGRTIGVGVATTYENYLKKDLVIDAEGAPPFEYRIDDANIQTYDTDLLALDDLRLGDGVRLDAAVTALPTIMDAINKATRSRSWATRCSWSPCRWRSTRVIPSSRPSSPRSSKRCTRTAPCPSCR